MLRDAIQKVMEEIALHEKEAREHKQQADALRRDLRESFAFLQDQKGKAKPGEVLSEKSGEADTAAKAEAGNSAAASRREQSGAKKKRGRKKA
jgi:hypothetical protein